MKKTMIIILALIFTTLFNACASTVHRNTGHLEDKTLNNNKVDFFTLLRVTTYNGVYVEADQGSTVGSLK